MAGPRNRTGRQLLRWFLSPFMAQESSFYRAVLACLLASALFWQMNALNKTYTTRLDYPLAWRYDTARYVPLRPLPARLPVTVTGRGWRLLRANLGWDSNPAELRPVPLPGTRYLPASAWRNGLQNALEGLQVNEWAGDTLRLTFDRKTTRRLRLALRPGAVPDSFRAQLSPAVVTFRGPATVLAALPNPYPVALPADETYRAGQQPIPIETPAQVRPAAEGITLTLTPRPAPRPRRRPAPAATPSDLL